MSALTSTVVCAVNSFATPQHLFDTVTKPTDVDLNFVSYPVPLFLFQFCPKCNNLICSW